MIRLSEVNMLLFQIFISYISDIQVMSIFVAIICIFLLTIKHIKEVYKIISSLVLSMFVTHTLKSIFAIPRPTTALVLEETYRFPSGHATMAAAVATLCVYYTHKHIPSKSVRVTLYILAVLWFLLVSYSRLYLGVHVLVDVVAGGIIGVISTLIVVRIFKHIRYYV